jgi:putative transcriptional regulator
MPKVKTSGRTKLGRDLEGDLRTILAHAKEEASLPTRYVRVPETIDVKAVRTGLRMSQSQFAKTFGFDPRVVQDWEQGRRQPETAARAHLLVIQRNPRAVTAALAIS